jgi:hypothetical protein
MNARQFAVRCAVVGRSGSAPPTPRPSWGAAFSRHERLRAELTAAGLDEVVVAPDLDGDALTVRGLAPSGSKEGARSLVEHQINESTLDLVILEPGVWIDQSVRTISSVQPLKDSTAWEETEVDELPGATSTRSTDQV